MKYRIGDKFIYDNMSFVIDSYLFSSSISPSYKCIRDDGKLWLFGNFTLGEDCEFINVLSDNDCDEFEL